METNAKPMSSPIKRYTIRNLMENLIYRLPGCTELMIRKELQHTLIEFCEITGMLEIDIPICYQEGVSVYPLNAPSDFTITQINSFRTNWEKDSFDYLDFTTRQELGNYYISFNRLPNNDDKLKNDRLIYFVKCVCVPTINCEDVPESFLQRFGTAIVSGTMARLMSMQGKAWSDVSQAAIKNIEYQNALNDACITKATQGKKQITFARGNFTSWF